MLLIKVFKTMNINTADVSQDAQIRIVRQNRLHLINCLIVARKRWYTTSQQNNSSSLRDRVNPY